MFCPNCGTQNPEGAQNCSKCNFVLKNVVPPKFKGTMLMMNQPPLPGGPVGGPGPVYPPPGASPVPAAPAYPPAAPAYPPPPSPYMANPMKGTMVGVAPMAGQGFRVQAPVAVPAPGAGTPAQGGPAPSPPALAYGNPQGGGRPDPATFSPPAPPLAVNPLGGTVAADANAYSGPFGPAANVGPLAPQGAHPSYPPANAFAGTVALPQAGPSPGGAPGFGFGPGGGSGPAAFAPGGGYSPPAGGYPPAPGGMPGGFGASGPFASPPVGGAFGGGASPYGSASSLGPFGSPAAPTGLAPYGSAGLALGAGRSLDPTMAKPTRRNPVLTWLLPLAVIVGGIIVSAILAIAISAALFNLSLLFLLGGFAWYVLLTIGMVNEVKSVTRNEQFAWWPFLVPIYNLVWALTIVPAEVTRAKQIVGAQIPTRSVIFYFFAFPYALAADINDLVR